MPEFARGGKAVIDDVVALPGSIADLSDPFKNSVLVAFGAYLRELRRSGRDLEDSERAALRAIRDKFLLFVRDCERESIVDTSGMLQGGIFLIEKILGEDSFATTRGSVRGWFARVLRKGGGK